MRITGNTISHSLVSQLNMLAARQARLQNQAASGQRISAPEDDPGGMNQALKLQQQHSQIAQYARNVVTLQTRAATGYTALEQVKSISDRAQEIAMRADEVRPRDELETLATELEQLIEHAVQLANARDGDQYVFAGTSSGQPPFTLTKDGNGRISNVTYQGNADAAQTEIGTNSTLSLDLSGLNTSGTGPRGVFADTRFGADFFNHLISLRDNLRAGNVDAIVNHDRPALAADEENLIYHVANNGVLQARLQLAAATAETQNAGLQQSLVNVGSADVTQTLVQLAETQNAFQVAAQSSGKLLQMQQVLLNYLP